MKYLIQENSKKINIIFSILFIPYGEKFPSGILQIEAFIHKIAILKLSVTFGKVYKNHWRMGLIAVELYLNSAFFGELPNKYFWP